MADYRCLAAEVLRVMSTCTTACLMASALLELACSSAHILDILLGAQRCSNMPPFANAWHLLCTFLAPPLSGPLCWCVEGHDVVQSSGMATIICDSFNNCDGACMAARLPEDVSLEVGLVWPVYS